MNEGLKPCPFCGNTVIDGLWNDDNEYQVGCFECNISTTGQTVDEAEETWNKRRGE